MHICEKTGWSWQYVLWGVSWNTILWGMADAPGMEEDDPDEPIKGDPSEARKRFKNYKLKNG